MSIPEFSQTCYNPYDRHDYKLHFKSKKTVVFTSWEEAQSYWFNWRGTDQLDYFEVLDKTKAKAKTGGFK